MKREKSIFKAWIRREDVESSEWKSLSKTYFDGGETVRREEGPCVRVMYILRHPLEDVLKALVVAEISAIGQVWVHDFPQAGKLFWVQKGQYAARKGGFMGYHVKRDEDGNFYTLDIQDISDFAQTKREVERSLFKSDIERLSEIEVAEKEEK